MRRGEVWFASAPAPIGNRPVVLISRDAAYARRGSATVVPISSRIRGVPAELLLGNNEGISQESVANADNIFTLTLRSLHRRIGELSPEKLRNLEECIRYALDLPGYER